MLNHEAILALVEQTLVELLGCVTAAGANPPDEILQHLSMTLSAVKRRRTPPPLLVQQPKGGLAAWQLRIAVERLSVDRRLGDAALEAANACRISRSHFSRAFKASTGMAPSRWRMEYRLKQAEALLREKNIPLVEVAERCGFSDQSHFTKTFSRLRSQSPGAWRRQAVSNARKAG